MLHDFVYLASASPRRAQLLAQAGIAFRPLLPDRDEDTETLEQERSGELPLAYVQRVALLKLGAARRRLTRRGLPPAPILCADTTVALGRRILGKPRDDEHAAATLRALSGRSHRVLTAVVVGHERLHHLATSTSRVRLAPLSEATIRHYVASGEPRGKAGAYAVQGRIAAWIEHLEGSYTGVVGLPLLETRTLLARTRVRLAP
ncbi:MAG: septum formation protein Maf [Burkholderiales bacterium]|nr:septum formation protein Maf [Burkholderiales bacterium]MDE2564950.1 septum formation protein Maf [Burkholderiales bacterium]